MSWKPVRGREGKDGSSSTTRIFGLHLLANTINSHPNRRASSAFLGEEDPVTLEPIPKPV